MSNRPSRNLPWVARPPIAIMGIPLDNINIAEAVTTIEAMVASGKPHYLATVNVDFLVQARDDVELRRILLEAHLVLCDGTPVLWASRLLGNPLPERVAGSDLIPLLIKVAAERKYRIYLLGASPEVGAKAVANLQAQYPGVVIAGQYSPPYSSLLDMDHEAIRRRIIAARPDLLLVGFGCPKQEKWINMHYRTLGVPVSVGVGGTIDFLAGHLKRAPLWMQRSGTEWVYRLSQEPRRLFGRYARDLWVFGWAILSQYFRFSGRRPHGSRRPQLTSSASTAVSDAGSELGLSASCQCVRPPGWFDVAAVHANQLPLETIIADQRPCVLDLSDVEFIDSTGAGVLIKLQKNLRALDRPLVLAGPRAKVQRSFNLLRLKDYFTFAPDVNRACELALAQNRGPSHSAERAGAMAWDGEITAATAEEAWNLAKAQFETAGPGAPIEIDLSRVPFVDSTGLGLMIRFLKFGVANGNTVRFFGVQPGVRNVVEKARLQEVLLEEKPHKRSRTAPVPDGHAPAANGG